MKEYLLMLVDRDLADALDNLTRAQMIPERQRASEYCETGLTGQEIIDGYQRQHDIAVAAHNWIKDNVPAGVKWKP